jgi:predicted flap endonuclease-1-like 5' DNA nuclease
MFRMMRNVGELSGDTGSGPPVLAEAAGKAHETIHVPITEPEQPAPAGAESKSKAAKKTVKPKAPAVPAPSPESAPAGPDDLKVLKGLGPVIEQTLNAHGITTYRQLAELDEGAIKDLEVNVLKSSGRFKRFDWVGQARELCAAK